MKKRRTRQISPTKDFMQQDMKMGRTQMLIGSAKKVKFQTRDGGAYEDLVEDPSCVVSSLLHIQRLTDMPVEQQYKARSFLQALKTFIPSPYIYIIANLLLTDTLLTQKQLTKHC